MRPKGLGVYGFTLIEILIVIVTLSILVGIAVPVYQTSVEKARRSEAIHNLSAIRQAEMRYYTQFGFYTRDLQRLDVTPVGQYINGSTAGQTASFGYGISSASSDSFTAYATRFNNSQAPSYSIEIDERGVIRDISLMPLPAFAQSAPSGTIMTGGGAVKPAEEMSIER